MIYEDEFMNCVYFDGAECRNLESHNYLIRLWFYLLFSFLSHLFAFSINQDLKHIQMHILDIFLCL